MKLPNAENAFVAMEKEGRKNGPCWRGGSVFAGRHEKSTPPHPGPLSRGGERESDEEFGLGEDGYWWGNGAC